MAPFTIVLFALFLLTVLIMLAMVIFEDYKLNKQKPATKENGGGHKKSDGESVPSPRTGSASKKQNTAKNQPSENKPKPKPAEKLEQVSVSAPAAVSEIKVPEPKTTAAVSENGESTRKVVDPVQAVPTPDVTAPAAPSPAAPTPAAQEEKPQEPSSEVHHTAIMIKGPISNIFKKGDIEGFNCTVVGESHLASGKPCQDYSHSCSENGIDICVVSDGHGGERYFRSDVGSKLAVEITLEKVRTFLSEDIIKNKLSGSGYKSYGVVKERPEVSKPEQEIVDLFSQLFKSIVTEWRLRIKEDSTRDITEWESSHVKQEYIDQLKTGYKIEKIYGCTLIAYARCENIWIAFQIGDGKCIAFNDAEELFSEPIPWDEQCFLARTTSLCGSSPLDDFRFCYEGDGKFPCAVFMGSDGIDDTFPEDSLRNFYVSLSKFVLNNGSEPLVDELKVDLPALSKKGSQDDMSIACIFDRVALSGLLPKILQKQLEELDSAISEMQSSVAEQKKKAAEYGSQAVLSEKQKVNYNYLLKDIAELEQKIEKVKAKKSELEKEIQLLKQ